MFRWLAIFLIPLTACASTPQTSDELLAPLPTTGRASTESVSGLGTIKQREERYVDNVRGSSPVFIRMNDQQIIDAGWFWCSTYGSNMPTRDITNYINEISKSESDRKMTLSLIGNAILDLCPLSAR